MKRLQLPWPNLVTRVTSPLSEGHDPPVVYPERQNCGKARH